MTAITREHPVRVTVGETRRRRLPWLEDEDADEDTDGVEVEPG
ncbi:hypothetical protein ACFWE5_03925 [Cellulosimicrobium funkei]